MMLGWQKNTLIHIEIVLNWFILQLINVLKAFDFKTLTTTRYKLFRYWFSITTYNCRVAYDVPNKP